MGEGAERERDPRSLVNLNPGDILSQKEVYISPVNTELGKIEQFSFVEGFQSNSSL